VSHKRAATRTNLKDSVNFGFRKNTKRDSTIGENEVLNVNGRCATIKQCAVGEALGKVSCTCENVFAVGKCECALIG
jgi:hypothetical protein